VFVLDSSFQLALIFAGKARSPPSIVEHLIIASLGYATAILILDLAGKADKDLTFELTTNIC
jgi:hypothetical protein